MKNFTLPAITLSHRARPAHTDSGDPATPDHGNADREGFGIGRFRSGVE